jgi:NADH-quinone oxidoreductase subunit H
MAVKGLLVIGMILQIVPGLIYLERKISAFIQGRIGPNRVGPFGLLQPVADAVKLLFKEEIIPRDADKVLYLLAPMLAFLAPALAFAFIPFGAKIETATDVIDMRIVPAPIGLLMLLSISSLGVYGVALGGWASNSKYPLMGSIRASAQMVSYSVAMGLALVAVVATVGSVDLQDYIAYQAQPLFHSGNPILDLIPNWLVFRQPVALIIFLVAMFAENNRLPFDLSEAEPELGAGYHAEYTGMKFAMFFLGEYVAMISMSGLFVTLFLGGWSLPQVCQPIAGTADVVGWIPGIISMVVFLTKLMLVLCFYMWVRWTLPRFRYDQLMRLGWKMLIPAGIANLFVTGVMLAL